MRKDRVQVVVLFAFCIAVVWLLGPPLRSWEILVVGTGAGSRRRGNHRDGACQSGMG